MKIREFILPFEKFAPLALQESWDNCGVQVGSLDREVRGVLFTLDVTMTSLMKAINEGANLIISHHPLIFSGLRSITGRNETEKIVIEAIKNDITIYSAHTNFDSAHGGVSFAVAQRLGLKNLQVLSPRKDGVKKIVTFVPKSHIEAVENAAFEAGAGSIGNYEKCGVRSESQGSFSAKEGATPFIGKVGELERVEEVRFETLVADYKLTSVLSAITTAHPYEVPAFDVIKMDFANNDVGLGVVGDIKPSTLEEIATKAKSLLGLNEIRISKGSKEFITRVALCGGSGASLINEARGSGAELYLTGDLKYHDFQNGNNSFTLMDIGHFESEKFIIDIFCDIVKKNFPNFAAYIPYEENSIVYI